MLEALKSQFQYPAPSEAIAEQYSLEKKGEGGRRREGESEEESERGNRMGSV